MMELPFRCEKCEKHFSTIDEAGVFCPNCYSSSVVVQWERIIGIENINESTKERGIK